MCYQLIRADLLDYVGGLLYSGGFGYRDITIKHHALVFFAAICLHLTEKPTCSFRLVQHGRVVAHQTAARRSGGARREGPRNLRP